jgi:putative endonuclease
MKGYVYIMTNSRRNVLYTGCTNDLKKRVYFHKRGLIGGFTKKYQLDRLVYFENVSTMEAARTRERQIKGRTRAKKIVLIESKNSQWQDLGETLE